MISKPYYKSRTIFSENLIAIHMKRTKFVFLEANQCVNAMNILEFSEAYVNGPGIQSLTYPDKSPTLDADSIDKTKAL